MDKIRFINGNGSKYDFNGRIPCALRSVGNKTLIESICDQYNNEVWFIINQKYINIVDKFLKYKGYNNIVLFPSDEYNNSDEIIFNTEIPVPKKSKCRFFNSIDIKDDVVIKTAIDESGKKLHDIEVEFYNKIQCPSMCKMISYNDMSMILEKINGQSCQEAIDNGYDKVELINKFKEALEYLNNIDYSSWKQDTEEDMKKAVKNELIDKIYDRVNPCQDIISIVSKDTKTFNDMEITPFYNLMSKLNSWYNKYEPKFAICHGDPNTDNVMLDKDGNIKMIDPRGYFGHLKTIGLSLVDYDLAKFVYGMSGYGHFNSTESLITNIDGDDIQATLYDGTPIMKVDIDELPISNDIKIIVGIIWMKLTSYIINDPVKSVAAYLHGNALLTKYLK